MDNDQLAAVAAQRLLHDLLKAVPGGLGSIARTIVQSGASPTFSSPDNCSKVESDFATIPPSGPTGWAPRVLALCCHAYGKPTELAVPVGACLELFGIVSYALDAVQDGHSTLIGEYTDHLQGNTDHLIRGQQRMALVTNAGVEIIGLAWQALLEHGPRYGIPPATIVEIGRLLASSWTSICYSQHLDLTLGRSQHLTIEEYDQIVAGKAGAIGGIATEAGALLAGAADQRQLWHALGAERMIAQQLWDDYTDLDEDLANGNQVSHPILYALAADDQAQRDSIWALLDQARSKQPDAIAARRTLTQMLEQSGSVQYTHACLLLHLENARAALRELSLPQDVANSLEQWISQVEPLSA